MAKNTGKRIPVKWIRDRAKSAYEKKKHCFICGTGEDLELHHTHSITLLLERWIKTTGRDFSTDEAVLLNRDEFINHHRVEIYDQVYTLCNHHHVALHSVFGKAPPLDSASRQGDWILTQKTRYESGELEPVAVVKRSTVLSGIWTPFICDISYREFY